MTLTRPTDAETDASAPPINVLFEEARRRRRRRWAFGLTLSFVLVVTAAAAFALSRSARTAPPRGHARLAAAAPPTAAGPGVAWIDYDGQLHLGNTATLTQRVMATDTGASATTPLTQADGRVYWIDTVRRFSPQSGYSFPTVHDVNVTTGVVSNDGPGQAVFLSADRRFLLIERTPSDLVATPIAHAGPSRSYTIPFGWSLVSDAGFALPTAVPSGFIISRPLGQKGSMTLALWQPDTGQVRAFGTGQGVFAVATPPGADHSLLAWLPANCEGARPCPLNITDTADFTTVHVPDPLPFGFDLGGAFSSDGSRLVVFVRTNSGAVNPTMQMGIADTASGRLRLVTGATSNIGESVGWALWLRNDRTVIGGALAGTDFTSTKFLDNHYLVNARTLTATPFTLIANRDLDVNFSAVAFPLPR